MKTKKDFLFKKQPDDLILFTSTQYLKNNIQYKQEEFKGKEIVIIPDWVIQAIQAGRIL